MFQETPRRRKRRGWLYLLIAGTLFVALSFGFTNLRSARADLREFVDLARRAALEQEALAAEFSDFMVFGIQTASRDQVNALFSGIQTTTRSRLNELALVEVPASGANAEALFNEAFEAWLAGTNALEAGLLSAADEPDSPIPVIAIDNALTEIRVGDRLYERFLLSVGELDGELEMDVGAVASVAYVPFNGLILTGEELAAVVREANEIVAFQDVRISQIELDPDFTGGENNGVGVVAFTESISAGIVVSNEGNVTEVDLTLVVTARTAADGAVVFDDRTVIVSMDPGASRTIAFPGIPVSEGLTHEISAVVTVVDGDIDSQNNSLTLPFFVQASS